MNPTEEPQPGQLLQVATDRVFGNTKSRNKFRDHDPAVAPESREDLVSALRSQHCCGL